MKYFKLLIIVIFLVSCESKLDLSPKGYIASSTFYKNAADAEAAVVGAYSVLQEVYRNEHILTPNEICADGGIPFLTGGADRIAIWNYSHTSSNLYPGQIWSSAYRGIQFSNIIVDRVPAISMDENLKNQYISEAKFLRALHYFNLVRFFGGVPLVTNETTSLDNVELPRSSVDDVYDLIEADLRDAEPGLPPTYSDDKKGRATVGAAKGLLAKVYLTRAGSNINSAYWGQAASKAKEVIDLKR